MRPDKPSRIVSILVSGTRITLGIIFIWASWDKLLAPADFARIIANYQILPEVLIDPAALLLPWVEIVCGVSLVLGVYKKGAVFIVTLLLIVFVAAYLSTVMRGIDTACGCFTVSLQAVKRSYLLVFRDLLFLGAALTILIYEFKTTRKRVESQKD
jgi:uncharacterized membrane protein YphA (DoxX/SURF4 family)